MQRNLLLSVHNAAYRLCMTRITFSIEEALAQAAEKVAEGDRRSLSSYITLLVERDLTEKNKHPDSPTDLLIADLRTTAAMVPIEDVRKSLALLRARVAAKRNARKAVAV